MKKALISLLIFTSILFNVYALGVDVNELKTGKEIQFINYTGLQAESTVEAIKGIGVAIARVLKTGKSTGSYGNKYTVIHAFDPAVKEKLDADIMLITKTAGVNHINSVRLIISGYLEEQYGYSVSQSRTLSVFITIYNAVYRKNLNYFKEKYKEIVTKNLNAEIVGLSVNYKDWPGSTQMIIPITEAAKTSDINALDTSVLTEKAVIDSLKAQDDKGIEDRKDIVAIKEQQLEQDKQTLEKTKEQLDKEKADLAKEKEALDLKKTNLDNTEKVITDTTVDDKTKEDIKVVTDKLKEDVKTTEDKVITKEQDIKTTEELVKKTEDKIVQKEQEIVAEKQDIAKDEKAIEVAKDPNKAAEEILKQQEELKKREEELKKAQIDKKIVEGKFYYLKINEYLVGGHYNNSLYILNAATGEVLVKSPAANISGHKYDIALNQGVVVITNKGVGTEKNYLSLLDLNTLEAKITSDDPIFHRSFVEFKENYIYAIVNLNNSYYVGKYDMQLKRVAVSTETVFEDSYVTFFSDRLYINSRDNKILALNKDDLTLIEKITPN